MALTIKRIERAKGPGKFSDGGGLYLQISKTGSKAWLFRYQAGGRDRSLGLGPLSTINLEEARELARLNRQLLLKGKDPITEARAERSANKAASVGLVTFKAATAGYYDQHSGKWKAQKVRQRFLAMMSQYAEPILGDIGIGDINTTLVLKVLEQPVPAFRGHSAGTLWTARTKSARLLRANIQAVLDWATVRGLRKGDNPAAWRGHLDQALVSPEKVTKVKHHSAMPHNEVAAFLAELRSETTVQRAALELVILSACRTNEVLGAEWSEFDLDKALWTIPKERMKMGVEHRVPLCDAAVALLRRQPRAADNKFAFPGFRRGGRLADRSLATLLKSMRPAYTTHGFRSSFKDWASEMTNTQHHIVEAALAHAVGSAVERAYARSDLLALRRTLMVRWADYVNVQPGKVLKLNNARK